MIADLRQLFMLSGCRRNNPNQGSRLVVAATDFMSGSTVSQAFQFLPDGAGGMIPGVISSGKE